MIIVISIIVLAIIVVTIVMVSEQPKNAENRYQGVCSFDCKQISRVQDYEPTSKQFLSFRSLQALVQGGSPGGPDTADVLRQ